MNAILISILSVVGVCVGAILQHVLAKAKETTARFEVRRHEAYADYLRGVAAVAIYKTDEGRALVTDAKNRIALYGSADVLAELAKFTNAGSSLANDAGAGAFLRVVEAMRRDSQSDTRSVEVADLHLVLMGLPPSDRV